MEIKKFKIRSLTATLAISFLILSTIILMVATGLETYSNFQAQKEIITSQQQIIAKDAANIVKTFVDEKIDIMQTSSNIGNLANADHLQQKLILDKLLGIEPSFRNIELLDIDGEELEKVSRLSTQANRFSQDFLKESISNAKNGEIYFSPVYIDTFTSEPMIVIAVPVTNIFGDIKRILVSEINLKFMWDLVGNIRIGEKGAAYVVDSNGNLIAFGDISRVLKGENLVELAEVKKFVENGKDIDVAETSTGITEESVVSTYVPLGVPDWAVVVEIPVDEAYKSVTQKLRSSILIMIFSFALAIIVAMYLSKRITKPIIELRDASAKIGEGKLDTKIEINTGDEIEQLASQFNLMAKQILTSKSNLEDLVKEKTIELQNKMEELERFNRLAVGRELKMIELKKKVKELEEINQSK